MVISPLRTGRLHNQMQFFVILYIIRIMQLTLDFYDCKNDNFPLKNCDIFLSLLKTKIEVVLTSTYNLCLRAKIRKKNEYPCKPQFHHIKTGVRGCNLHGHVILMYVLHKLLLVSFSSK